MFFRLTSALIMPHITEISFNKCLLTLILIQYFKFLFLQSSVFMTTKQREMTSYHSKRVKLSMY